MPACVINSCSDLLTCLEQAVQGASGSETLALSAALFPAAGDLAGYFGLDTLTLTQINATPLVQSGGNTACAIIHGTAALFPNGGQQPPFVYDVTINTDVAGSTVSLVLTAAPVDVGTWTFSGNFAALPDYVGFVNPGLGPLPSFYNTMAAATPVFHATTISGGTYPLGLSFSASVDLTQGALAAVGTYFPDATSLPLSGTVQMQTGSYPLLQFIGTLTGYSVTPVESVFLAFGTTNPVTGANPSPGESTLLLAGVVKIGTLTLDVSTPLLQDVFVWSITGEIANKENYPLSAMLTSLVSFAGGATLPLPSGMDAGGFYLDSVNVLVVPGTSPTVQGFGFRVTSGPGKSWTAPLFGLTVSDLATEWFIMSPASDPQLQGTVTGVLRFGTDANAPRLQIVIGMNGVTTASAPDVSISAQLDPDYPVQLGQLFSTLTGTEIDLDLEIAEMVFTAETGPRTLQFTATLDGEWPFSVPLLTFGTTNFLFQYTPNSISGMVSVEVTVVSFVFLVSAAYARAGQGWQFAGQLAPGSQGNTLQAFVDAVTDKQYPDLPGNLGAITLSRCDISFDTGTSDFSFDGVLTWPFQFDTFDVVIAAELSLQSPGPATGQSRQYAGFVRGSLSINAFECSVIYRFDIAKNTSLTFAFAFRGVTLTCVYTKDAKTGVGLLTASLGGVTFGGIIEYLVNLVDPNLNFSLPTPWDVLNQISFDNLVLTVNLTTKEVGISYKLDQDLGIVDIDTIGLTYVNRAGRKTVEISITGRFFDQEYKADNPLGWDLLNDPPPSPPGKGTQLLDLRYLGIGQNVGFRQTRNFQNVQDVLAAMEGDFLPPDAPDQNPLTSPALKTLKFTGDGHWLMGADFTLMEAVSLTIVFNDPVLYGLRVALAGDKVKNFAGLDFQILYKKVTDTIGVYHIELTLPEAFRQLQFGAVAVTLPVIVVDIYTNGNFRLDFGFPVGTDFSNSFCVQAGPFIGYGGFYFALLDGSTSDRVPKITNGTFSPVIEAGLALSVGLGRTFNQGVLSAGATISLQAIVQGVFGWFNPNDRSDGTALYYWIQGTASLVGKVFGSVNFVVISAEVNVTAQATLTLTIEACQPIEVDMSVSVEVSVSLKIVFFRVNFSFGAHLDFSFSIGSGSPTPWLVDNSQSSSTTLRQQRPFTGHARLSGARLQRRLLGASGQDLTSGTFDWTPRAVFGSVQDVAVSVVPTLTVAPADSVFATHAAGSGAGAELQIVMSLFVGNSVPTEVRRARDVRTVTMADAALAPFNLLAAGLLRWALSSYTRPPGQNLPPPGTDTLATDLEAISGFLGDPAQWRGVFTYDALAALMALNYRLCLSTPYGPSGMMHPDGYLVAPGQTGAEVAATIFPMIPDLQMAVAGETPVQFWKHGSITPAYESALGEYYQQLKVASGASGPSGLNSPNGPVGASGSESLASYLFRDYFAMIAKGAVQDAATLLKAYPYEATGAGASGTSGPTGAPETLSSIAEAFTGMTVEYRTVAGDTLGKVAGRFGVSPSDLQTANPALGTCPHRQILAPGTLLAVATGVTPAAIAAANADYPLQALSFRPVPMAVSGVKHQVKISGGPTGQSESLGTICGQYGIGDLGSVFTYLDTAIPPANPNVSNPELLQPGASMLIPAQTVQVPAADDVSQMVAAFFFVRSIGPAQPADAQWYSAVQFFQQYITANNDLTQTSWKVPVVVTQSNGGLGLTGTTEYQVQGAIGTALSPDTPGLVAGYFAMLQLEPEPYKALFEQFASIVSATGASHTYAVGSFDYKVAAGDTFGGVAQKFGIAVDTLAQANAQQGGLFQPLAVLALPPIAYGIAAGDTLGSVAAKFDLTLDELADSAENSPGILQPFSVSSRLLTIPDVPGRATGQLIADLVQHGRFNNLSGMLTRFLLHGLRVPEPGTGASGGVFPPNTPLWGLYEMAGQQFPAPTGLAGPSGHVDITFTKATGPGPSLNWICFAGPTGPSGSTAHVHCESDLVVHLNGEFVADAPSLTLWPEVVAGPGPLPLYHDRAPQYSMQQSVHWQAAAAVTLPGPTGAGQPVAGQPSLWNFPPALLVIAAQGPPGPTATPQYELMTGPVSNQTGASDAPVEHYAWASTIDLRVQRAPDAAGNGFLPNTYVLLGADQNGRDRLLNAWNYLRAAGSGDGTISLLYPPSAAGANSKGLASDGLDPVGTFLLKSNLTTVTQSNSGMRDALSALRQSAGNYYARLESVGPFLLLAWEASVTGAGGFYLNYVNASGGGGLPETLFADGAEATITLLLQAGPQTNISSPDHGLYPFNNCAVVGDSVDPASSRLYVRLAEPLPGDLVRAASLPAGNVGFYLARTNPDPGGTGAVSPTGPADQTRNLFNLTGYQLAGNAYFQESNQGLPSSPTEKPIAGISGPTGPGIWWYEQVLPVSRFGSANAAPSSAALPLPALNPYAGITGPSGPGPRSEAVIDLSFNDIFGNQIGSSGPVGPVAVIVGYTDEIIGLSTWPGAGADFLFSPGPSGSIELATQLTAQAAKYVPAGTYSFKQANAAAAADAARYAEIFFQVQQLDLGFALQTNLGTLAIAPDALKAPLGAFVSKAKVFTDAAAALVQQSYPTTATDTLESIATAYRVSLGALLEANADLPLAPLFQGKIVQPILAAAGPMNTLVLLVANQASAPWPPTCANGGSACTGGAAGTPLTPGELAQNNLAVALTPGIVLITEPIVSALPTSVPNTLRAVAAALQCAVYAEVPDPVNAGKTIPVGLFQDNLILPGVVAPDLTIEIDGVQVSTGAAPTFQSVQTAFQSLGLNTGDFVAKLQTQAGIFAPAAQITHASFSVPTPAPSKGVTAAAFTLAELPAGSGTVDFIATQNSATTNFFTVGSTVTLGYGCYQPTPFDTFASVAQKFSDLSLAQLGLFNAVEPLRAGVDLLIPNLVAFPNAATVYAPYSPTPTDSLATIAQTFATTVAVVAALNQHLPGIFADGAAVPIGNGQFLHPAPLDSLQSMAVAAGTSFDAFIAVIQGAAGLYRRNGVIITPLPVVPDNGGSSPALDAMAQVFNVQGQTGGSASAVPLLTANRCLQGFLRAGGSVAGPTGTTPLTVGAHDTLDTILYTFSTAQNTEVTLDQIAQINGPTANLLTAGSAFLLPPNPTPISTPLQPQVPPTQAGGESAIVFPVSVTMEMTRNLGLVAPDFAASAAVFGNASFLTPRGWQQDASSLDLAAFAGAFESAFAAFRLKCAVAKPDSRSDPRQTGHLWAVNFGSSGVSEFAVDSTAPEFYALAPLSTSLMNGTLPVQPYQSGIGLGAPISKTFNSVDLDGWMLQFLSTVDLFLSAPYATPAFGMSAGPSGQAESSLRAIPLAGVGPVGLGGEISAFSLPWVQVGNVGATGSTGMTGIDGPANFDDIVESKRLIADLLRLGVVPVLRGVGATGGYNLDVAQEALRQQMLVRLADAYNVGAIIQYPVGMQSPCVTPWPAGPTAAIPPRVSGKIVPDLYTVSAPQGGAAATLKDLAAHFGVSTPFLAETIGDLQGLLLTGATVHYGDVQVIVTIGARATLNSIAAEFGVPADPSAAGYWELWTAFADGIGEEPIVVPGAQVPIVGIERQVRTGETLGAVADFFGVDAGTVGEANQSATTLFNPGQTIAVPGHAPYQTKANDSLTGIAATIGITVAVLAQSIATQTALLAVGANLFLTQTLPDVTLSTTKVSLGRINSAQGADPTLSFLFSVKHPRQYKSLFLNLKYVINEMEYGIANVSGVDDYQASSWLTFLLPPGSGQGVDVGVETAMKQVVVPIPLRSYPVPPTVTAQSGLPSVPPGTATDANQAITDGKNWDYRLDFQSQSAAQDTDYVEVSLNAPPAGLEGQELTRTEQVFQALAGFMEIYPQLLADLAILPGLPPGSGYDPNAAVAVAVLDTLTARVASALAAPNGEMMEFGGQFPELKYLYRLETQAANDELKELQLGLVSGPTGIAAWPEVWIQSLTAPTAGTGPDAGFLKLNLLGATGATASYDYPEGFAAGAHITQRLIFRARDVMQNQNALGGIYVTRNESLIASGPLGSATGPSGPTGPLGGIPTNPAFIYQTPLVTFIDRLTPFLDNGQPIDVAGLTGPTGPRPLAEHLEITLDTVLESVDSQCSLLCSYGFPVSTVAPDLIATTPIRFVPTQLLTVGGVPAFAGELAASLEDWLAQQPPNIGGRLIFDLSVFTTPPGMSGPSGQAASLKPILEFANLQVPTAKIGGMLRDSTPGGTT